MSEDTIILHSHSRLALSELAVHTPHAILLSGPKGNGKTHLARQLALQLLGDLADGENVASLRVVRPEKSSISIEQIRTLLHFFRLKVPGKAAVQRVAIIEDAETMGLEAQNALLKALEEPPQGSVLILTSSEPNTLLATIRSRLQNVYLSVPDTAALVQHFAAQGFEASVIQSALLRAGTNVAEAGRLLSQAEPDVAIQTVKQALSGNAYDRLLLVDSMSKQKDTATAFVDALAVVAMVSLDSAAAKSPQNIPRWQAILRSAHTAQEALSQSGNTKLVLTELMLGL